MNHIIMYYPIENFGLHARLLTCISAHIETHKDRYTCITTVKFKSYQTCFLAIA